MAFSDDHSFAAGFTICLYVYLPAAEEKRGRKWTEKIRTEKIIRSLLTSPAEWNNIDISSYYYFTLSLSYMISGKERFIMPNLKGTKTEQNLMTAFAGESQATNKYTYFFQQSKKGRLCTDR